MTSPVNTGTAALLSAAEIWATPTALPNMAARITSEKVTSEKITTEKRSTEKTITEKLTIEVAPPVSAVAADTRFLSPSERLAAAGAASRRNPAPPHAWPPRKLSLALQGGGSFAAFTWGVLDRLLDEPDCDLDAISGAGAGAVNGVLLACGLVEDGRRGAQSRLKQFWTRMTNDASFRSVMLVGGFSPAGSSVAFGPALRSGQFDPPDLDPLRQVLAQEINFWALRAPSCPKLLVAATRVRDGRLQIFRNQDITADVVLASTCPPLVHCAVEIEGESYWDGGYAANPPVVRLAHETSATDLLVVQITPARDRYIPMTMAAIDRRLDQITANSTLNAEIAALDLMRDARSRSLRVSQIAAEDEIDGLAQRSAVDLGRSFVEMLHRSGRAAAERWLKQDPAQRPPTIQERVAELSAPPVQPAVKETVDA
jgi:NTE family protein